MTAKQVPVAKSRTLVQLIDRQQVDKLIANSELARLAKALVEKLDGLTTQEFALGGESAERCALHRELFRIGAIDFDENGYNRVVFGVSR